MPRTARERLDDWKDRIAARPAWVLVLAALPALTAISPLWYATPDSTSYLSIARSFWSPDGPTNLGSRHLYFSLGYPTLISPLFFFGSRPFVLIGLVNWLLTLVVLFGVYIWARPWGTMIALAGAAGTTVHALWGVSARRPLSETAFAAAMILAVLALNAVRTAATPRRRAAAAIVGTLLLASSCLVRPHGMMLIAGLATAWIVASWHDRRRLRQSAALAALIGGLAAAAFFLARSADDRRAGGDASHTYFRQLLYEPSTDRTLLERIPGGIVIQLCDLQRIVVPGMFKMRSEDGLMWLFNLLVAGGVGAVTAVGWWSMARGRGDVWAWTMPFYLALNVMWGADVGTRYTLPIMPLVLTAFWLGLSRLVAGAARWVVPWLALQAAVGLCFWLTIELPRNVELNQTWYDVATLSANVDPNTETVGSWRMTPTPVQLFRYVLDRPVRPFGNETPTEAAPDWLVAPSDVAESPRGYARAAASGPYVLYRRDAP